MQILFRMGNIFSFLAKKNYLLKMAATAVCCLAITACGQITMEDYSSAPEYANVLGKKFRVKEDLWAIGITSDANYKKQIDYIVLVPGVGFTGPEVIFRERFNKGSVIKIVGVLKAKSYISSKVAYIVEVVDSHRFKDAVIRITQTSTVDQNFGLDESIYEKMNESP